MTEITREEIELAIDHIADNVRFLKTHSYTDNSLKHHELALVALKEMLTRQENAPLTIEDVVSEAYDRGYNLGYSDGYQDGTKGEETE